MYHRYEWERQWDRQALEEERRLISEVTDGRPISWKKLGKIIQLGAMLRSDNRHPY